MADVHDAAGVAEVGVAEVEEADVAEVEEALRRLKGAWAQLRARPQGEIVVALGRTGARFVDEADAFRRRALEALPSSAHLSPEMARVVLDGMASDWTEGRLRDLIEAEFASPAVLDGFTHAGGPGGEDRGRRLMAVGPRLCVQIVSGSVPGVSVHALIRSLLVKSPTLLKPGRGDALLPTLFAEALAEEDAQLAEALAVVNWPGGAEDVERLVLSAAEVAVVYGADATVASVRDMAPATTRVVAYHHRVGVGVVGREALGASRSAAATAVDVARAVALFEQRGCVCPQLVFVEEGGSVGPPDFARALAEAFASLEIELPSPPLSPEEASSLVQLRGTMELYEAGGAVELHHGGGTAPWTVIFEAGEASGPAGTSRTVRVRPISDVETLPDALAPLGPHLQSVGYAGLGSRAGRVAEALGQTGASRVVPFTALSFPPPWWLHDGRGPLRELVRWVELERE